MGFNLIDERWLPVLRESGRIERIAPWQIAESSDRVIKIRSPRPDFDAALLEFLIGLVQSTFVPKDGDEWADIYESGTDAEALRAKMEAVRDAFWLDGDGPRFMQDLTVHEGKCDLKPVVSLLMDEGVSGEASLFAKSGRFESFCLPDAAAAMMTLQAFAPSGGAGHRTSLRGGGPISVAILNDDLWKTVWCNILSSEAMRSVPGNLALKSPHDIFPWMAPTRTSEAGATGIAPSDIHPLQHFWAMPRRYRFKIDGAMGTCDICDAQEVEVVQQFFNKNYGANYKGPFLHPMTPYSVLKPDQLPNPKKGDGSGFSYRDWPLVSLGGEKQIIPKVVETFRMEERAEVAPVTRILARGYGMDNMKPLRFLEAKLPLIHVSENILPLLRDDAGKLVVGSEQIRKTLNQQVKAAWKERPKDQSGDVQARTDASYWDQTSTAFFKAIEGVRVAIQSASDEGREAAKISFLKSCREAALNIFDELCPIDVDLSPDSLARTVQARHLLLSYTSPSSKSLRTSVGLGWSSTSTR